MTTEEIQAKQIQLQTYGMYIGVASLVIAMLSLYWNSQPKK